MVRHSKIEKKSKKTPVSPEESFGYKKKQETNAGTGLICTLSCHKIWPLAAVATVHKDLPWPPSDDELAHW
jgi:hypothetical protein